jgi:hypothetical protein
MALNQNIHLTCSKCGTKCKIDLLPDEMRNLIISGNLEVYCCNENCKGFWGSTKITLNFDDVIRQNILSVPKKKRQWTVVESESEEEKEEEKTKPK